jgi:hypothetical protein
MTRSLPQYFSFDKGIFFHIKNLKDTLPPDIGLKVIDCELQDYTQGMEGISVNYTFRIVINVEITSALRYLIRLRVYEVSGVLIFVCSTLKNAVQLNEPGKYKVMFEMPAHIFNESMYSFDFAVINDETQTLICREDKFLTVKMSGDVVVDFKEQRDYLPGVTKPAYKTETIKLT